MERKVKYEVMHYDMSSMTKRNKTSTARETVYDRCAYVGCYNGKFINGRRLFHFPAETDRRLEMWIERSGNFRLRTWAATSLRKAGLCGDHFDDKSFTNSTKKALRRNVVPRHYTEDLKYRKANQEDRENNENNKNINKSDGEDEPMSCDRTSSPPVELEPVNEDLKDDCHDESSLHSTEYGPVAPIKTAPRTRSPSPLVEFIVEELDESLIYDQSELPNGASMFEEEVQEEDKSEEKEETIGSPSSIETNEEAIKPVTRDTYLTVMKTSPDVRTYNRAKNNNQENFEEFHDVKEEFPWEETEQVVAEEDTTTIPTKLSVRRNNVDCTNPSHRSMLLNFRSENKQLRKTVRLLRQNLRRSKARETDYLKVRHMLQNIDTFLNIQECTNPVARAMVKLALHKPKTPFTKEEKDFATSLYENSPAAFVILRRAGCNFPGKSTMKRWITSENGVQSTEDSATMHETDGEFDEADRDVDEADRDVDEAEHYIDEAGNYIDETGGYVDEASGDIDEENDCVPEAMDDISEAFEDAEEAIDELVEHLEVQIEDAGDQEEYIEALPPDDEDEEDAFK